MTNTKLWHLFSQGELNVYLLEDGKWRIEHLGIVIDITPDRLFWLAYEDARIRGTNYENQYMTVMNEPR